MKNSTSYAFFESLVGKEVSFKICDISMPQIFTVTSFDEAGFICEDPVGNTCWLNMTHIQKILLPQQ